MVSDLVAESVGKDELLQQGFFNEGTLDRGVGPEHSEVVGLG